MRWVHTRAQLGTRREMVITWSIVHSCLCLPHAGAPLLAEAPFAVCQVEASDGMCCVAVQGL